MVKKRGQVVTAQVDSGKNTEDIGGGGVKGRRDSMSVRFKLGGRGTTEPAPRSRGSLEKDFGGYRRWPYEVLA